MRPISIANEAYFNRQRYAVLPSPKGANVNNRGWNDQRSWNLRIANILSLYRPQRGRTGARLDVVRPLRGRFLPLYACPQVPCPLVIPPAVIESWPPSGTVSYLRNMNLKYLNCFFFLQFPSLPFNFSFTFLQFPATFLLFPATFLQLLSSNHQNLET